MNEEILNKLKELQKSIEDYADYLEQYTYHPYDKVQGFSWNLMDIIKEIEDNRR
jgi:hypothetical protein